MAHGGARIGQRTAPGVGLALCGAEGRGDDLLAQVRRAGLQLGAVEQHVVQAGRLLQRDLAAQPLDLLGGLGHHEAAVLRHTQIGTQLGLQARPGALRVQVQRDGLGRLARGLFAVLDHAVLELEMQAARVLARGLGVELVALDQQHLAASGGQQVGDRAAQQATAYHQRGDALGPALGRGLLGVQASARGTVAIPRPSSVARTCATSSAFSSSSGRRT